MEFFNRGIVFLPATSATYFTVLLSVLSFRRNSHLWHRISQYCLCCIFQCLGSVCIEKSVQKDDCSSLSYLVSMSAKVAWLCVRMANVSSFSSYLDFFITCGQPAAVNNVPRIICGFQWEAKAPLKFLVQMHTKIIVLDIIPAEYIFVLWFLFMLLGYKSHRKSIRMIVNKQIQIWMFLCLWPS